jgi:glycosyltransferase involved in cell wall biosynthesis
MRLHALLNIYNDAEFLPACLTSLKDVVDEIVVADGAYDLYFKRYKEFNPDARPFSTDGSIEIINALRGLPRTVYLHNPDGREVTWKNQVVKRTALLDAVPVGDYFIIIDADEMLMGDVQESLERFYDSGCVVGSQPLYNPGTHMERVIPQWHPRVFRKLPNMHYKGTHWHLRDQYERIIEDKYPIFWTDNFAIVHFKSFKDQTRLIPHQNYMVDLLNRNWQEPQDCKDVVSTIEYSRKLGSENQ